MLMNPVKTSKIADGVCAVRTAISNFYIYDAGESLLAFDTGINPFLAASGMRKLGLDPGRVSHVFLTHSDYDHAGGLKAFRNAKMFISIAEEPMVTRRRPRLLFIFNKRLRGYLTLGDRQTVTAAGCEIMLISTPGHTPGSACYLINGEILVAGDTLRVSKGGFTPFFFPQNMSHSGDKKSLAMLINEGFTERASLILTGHTGILKKTRGDI